MGFYNGQFNPTQQVANVYSALGVPYNGPSTYQMTQPAGQAPSTPAAPAPAAPKQASTYSAPKVNPYAKWGDQAGLNASKQNIFDSFNVGADKAAYDYGTSVEDTIRGLRDNQNALNLRGAQNELAKMQGRQGVLGMVSRGVNSTGTMLGNRNAADSSAAQTLAQVYGQMGSQEMNKISNQYAMQNEELGRLQATQDEDMATKTARLRQSKDIAVNDLVNKARASLAALNAEMVSAAVPDRIALEQESARIKNELLGRLQQYDSQLASAPSNIRADSSEAKMAAAQRMATAGTELANPFQFDQIGTQAQTGPFSGNLPLFTYPRNKQRS